jgi:hypothetical protein
MPDYTERTGDERVQLLRIELHKEYTKLDLGYTAPAGYNTDGWLNIAKDAFIEHKETGERYPLTKTDNIPIAPERLALDDTLDRHYFSLYFPPVPKEVTAIDLVENEHNSDAARNEAALNFYGLRLHFEKEKN